MISHAQHRQEEGIQARVRKLLVVLECASALRCTRPGTAASKNPKLGFQLPSRMTVDDLKPLCCHSPRKPPPLPLISSFHQ